MSIEAFNATRRGGVSQSDRASRKEGGTSQLQDGRWHARWSCGRKWSDQKQNSCDVAISKTARTRDHCTARARGVVLVVCGNWQVIYFILVDLFSFCFVEVNHADCLYFYGSLRGSFAFVHHLAVSLAIVAIRCA